MICLQTRHSVTWWGQTFVDDYFYMRNRAEAEAYLKEEEAYECALQLRSHGQYFEQLHASDH